jgi:hypothetical protein
MNTTIEFLDADTTGGAGNPLDTYVPGGCNIGREEIARRRSAAVTGALVTIGTAAVLIATGAPDLARLLVAIPAAGTAIAALQVRNRFCVAYAAQGVYNVDGAAGEVNRVGDADALRRDRRRAARMVAAGAAAGALAALALLLIP